MTAAAASSLAPPLQWALDVLRRWRWRTSLLAVLIGVANPVYRGMPLWGYGGNGAPDTLAVLIYNVLQFGFPLAFAVQWADRAVDCGLRARWVYTGAVLLVGMVGIWAIGPLLTPQLGAVSWWDIGDDISLFLFATFFHALGVGAYVQWRGARLALERLQATARERAARRRQLTASRLLALQARVEPQLLFDCLARIDRALDDKGDEADRRLADLIDLLRAMQPAVQARASTLGREVTLIEAYARVSGQVGLQSDWLQFDIADAAAAVPFAPMVLLPLLRGLAAVPTWRWQVQAALAGARLRITLAAPGTGSASFLAAVQALDIDELCQRLAEAHGGNALLRVDADALRVLIEVDAEDDAHPDR